MWEGERIVAAFPRVSSSGLLNRGLGIHKVRVSSSLDTEQHARQAGRLSNGVASDGPGSCQISLPLAQHQASRSIRHDDTWLDCGKERERER